MKTNWQIKNIEDCIDKIVYTNKIHRKDFLESGIFPVISQEQDLINGYWNKKEDVFHTSKPVVVFGDHTQILKYIDFDFVLGADGVKLLQPKEFLHPKYFYYFLQSINLPSLGYARHYRLLKENDISYPESIFEQKRIVKTLDEAFEKLEKTKEDTKKNLQNSKELFESYLGDIFSRPAKNWEKGTVFSFVARGYISKPQDGNHGEAHPHRSDYVPNGVPFIMACDLINGCVDQINSKFISEKLAKSLRIGFAKNEDVLLSHKGTIGRAAILETDKLFVILTPQITYYRILDKSKIYNKFLYYYFLSNRFQDQMQRIAGKGSTRAYIGITKQEELDLLIAPLTEQKQIVKKLDKLSERTQKLEYLYRQKLENIEELKKSILSKAFSEGL